jgi:hypothetical protein
MDTLANYKQIIRQLMEERASYKISHGEIESELIMDDVKGHYELLHIGWDGPRRVHGVVIHIDIIGDKVWIQHDGTPGVASDLVEAGIARQDIVLGFRPAYVRPYTDFGVG